MSFDDLRGDTFPVKYWYVHKTDVRKRDSNEMVQVDRVVLLSEDFRSVQFTSRGILDSLMQMVDCIGEGPYDPAEVVAFRKIKTPAGSTYSMEPADDEVVSDK
jgi:hypothetical protein